MPSPRRPPPSVRRELFLSTAVLFAGAVLVAVAVVALSLPLLRSPLSGAVFVTLLIAADLAILFAFLRSLLRRTLFDPLDRIGAAAGQIAGGAYEQRIAPEEGELDGLVQSVNAMAARLIAGQRKLADNIVSLDRTNRDLVGMTEELVRASRLASVGTLAAGLAHEVGNPLGALTGYLDVARRRAKAGGDVDAPLEAATDEAQRIDRIVRSVMEFARPGVGEVERPDASGELTLPTVALPEVVDRSISLLEGRGALQGVALVRSIQPGVHRVFARGQHIEQVLMNLLMNALLAVKGRPDPRVTIRVTGAGPNPASLRAQRADDPPGTNYLHRRRLPLLISGEAVVIGEVVLEVRDNGPGIPPGRISKLFDPFFTTRAPGEGTGLGLAITARIVQGLGGRIAVANAEGGGALFTVRLPAAGEGD